MVFTKEQVLYHLDNLIERQIEELNILISAKPKIGRSIRRSREALDVLTSIRSEIQQNGCRDHQAVAGIMEDMKSIGWYECEQ